MSAQSLHAVATRALHQATATTRPRARPARRTHLIFAFSLLSAAIARIVLQVLETRVLDAEVANAGVAIAAGVGALTSVVLHALRDREGWRLRVWAIIPIAGAIVGMITQGLLLVNKPDYRFYVVSEGIDSNHPVAWIVTGAPFGAFPALVAGLVLWIALRVTSRVPSHDARERMLVPLAGGCAILHAITLSGADGNDLAIVLFVLALSILALVEVFFADRSRIAWVRRVFNGDHAFSLEEIVSSGGGDARKTPLSVPLIVGGIRQASLLVMGDDVGERGYRTAAREPFAAVASTVSETIAPIILRRIILVALLSVTALTTSIALFVR